MPDLKDNHRNNIEKIKGYLQNSKKEFETFATSYPKQATSADEKINADVIPKANAYIKEIEGLIQKLNSASTLEEYNKASKAAVAFLSDPAHKQFLDKNRPHPPAPTRPPPPRPKDISDQKSEEGPLWLRQKNRDRVIAKLSELSKTKNNEDLVQVINTFKRNYDTYLQASGDSKEKAEKLLYSIIHFPGWGVVENSLDDYTTLKPEDVDKFVDAAVQRYKEENLEGTEEVIRPIIESYALQLSKRVAKPGEAAGKELDPDEIGKMPVICIDGPPGTGKTTVAKAISKALEMGFYDISLAGQDDTNLVYGHGPNWVHSDPGIVAKAMMEARRQRTLILLDETEKTKGTDLANALGQILEPNQRAYKDSFFNANIDKRKCMFVLTTNKFELLPDHIQDRVERVYLKGYSDEQKIGIVRNLVEKEFARIQGIKFQSMDPKKRAFFTNDKNENDAIRYLVENYITEPGVREARALIMKIQAAANNVKRAKNKRGDSSDFIIDENFITQVLKEPNPSIRKIKIIDNQIQAERKDLTDTSVKLRKKFNKIDEKNQALDEKTSNEIEILVKEMIQSRNEVITLEHKMLRELKIAKGDPGKFSAKIPGRIEEHTRDIENTNSWTSELLIKAKEYFPADKLPKSLSSAIEDSNKVLPFPSPAVSTAKTVTVEPKAITHLRGGMGAKKRAKITIHASEEPHSSEFENDTDSEIESEYGSDTELGTDSGSELGADRKHGKEKHSKGTHAPAEHTKTTTPAFKAAALRAAKLGAKMKHKGGASPISSVGWVEMYKEVKEKIQTEIEKGQNPKKVRNLEKYEKLKTLDEHTKARLELYTGWSAEPEQNESTRSFDLKKTSGKGPAETMATVSRNLEKKQIEIVASEPIPDDATIFHMLEVSYTNARRTGNPKISISDCDDAKTAIKIREYAVLMKLQVTFDAETDRLIKDYTHDHPDEANYLIQGIKSQEKLIGPESKPSKGPRLTSSSSDDE